MEWMNRLSQAIEYIEKNLDGEISYDETARIACCSAYYFQRLFSYVTGISASEYIRRRRMSQAGFELQRTDIRVLDVALKYGYTSPTSFNRAFQAVHGIPPAAAKKQGVTLNAYPPIRLSVEVTGGNAMSYQIMKKPQMRIVGVRTRLTDDIEKNQKIVPQFWEKLLGETQFSTLCEMENRLPKGLLGVSLYQDPKSIFYYIATSTDGEVPKGMFEYVIPASTWVIFENDGVFKENVLSVFRRFYTEWIPFSGYEYANLPDIEVYPIMDGKPLEGHSEVWIAIRQIKEGK